MPDIKFTQLPEIPTASAGDYIPLIDISDDSMSDDGSNVVIRVGNLANSFFTSLSDGAILSSKIQVNPTFTGNVTLPSTTIIGNITGTQLGFLSGLRNNIQYQLDNPSFPPFGTLNVGPGTQTNAPLLIKAGTNTITPTSGAIEYDGSNLYFSDNTPTRQTVATKNYVDTSITNLIGTAPAILNTLGEIADSIADNGSYAAYVQGELNSLNTTKAGLAYVNTELAKKADLISPTFTGTITSEGLTASRDGNVILSANRHDATTEGPELNLIKTRGTIAAPVIVSSADELGDIAFAGYNGLNNQRAATIRAFADGAPSSSSIFPGVRIGKVGTETGALGGTTTISSVDGPSTITISSADPNTVGPVTFRTLYSGNVVLGSPNTTATITGLTTTAGLFVGQVLRRDGGAGAFGDTPTISSVDSSSQITISSTTANGAGAIVFDYIATGTISASTASTTITGMNSTAGFYPGQKLRKLVTAPVGVGAFGGITTVVSVDSLTQLTISSTTANTLGSLTFACGWSGNISGISNSTTITGITSGFSVAGRLTFNTTSPGNTGVTERMRITSAGNIGIGTSTPTAKLNVVDNSSLDVLRITQSGSGNALVVEDSISSDITPFIIDSDGKVITSSSLELYSNDGTTTSSNAFAIHKSRGTKSAPTLPSSGDAIFSLSGKAYNGATYEDTATIQFAIDGAIGQLATSIIAGTYYRILTVGNTNYTLVGAPTGFTVGTVFLADAAGSAVAGTTGTVYRTAGDMPGRIIFNTGSDGGPLAERMRIAANGRVGIGTTSPSAMLHVTQSSTTTTAVPALQITHLGTGTPGNAVVIEDEAATDTTPFVISNTGDVGIGTSTPLSKLHVVGNLTMTLASTANSATAGTVASALPALPLGYLQITLNGTAVKIPYYSV